MYGEAKLELMATYHFCVAFENRSLFLLRRPILIYLLLKGLKIGLALFRRHLCLQKWPEVRGRL